MRNTGPGGAAGPETAVLIVIIIVAVILVIIGLVVAILFYLTLMRCLERIRPSNREMEPAMVWLNMIPCFGMVWIFITVQRLGESLRKEFRSRRWDRDEEGFGIGVGTAYAALSIASAIPYLGGCFALASLVCFIIYWVQIAQYSARLEKEPADRYVGDWDDEEDEDDRPRRRSINYEDEEDDRPRRRSRRDEDDEPDSRFRRGRDEDEPPEDRIRRRD